MERKFRSNGKTIEGDAVVNPIVSVVIPVFIGEKFIKIVLKA